jgi:hypothetical protein
MIGFIGTSITIATNYNSSQSVTKTRSIPYWTTSVFSSAVTNHCSLVELPYEIRIIEFTNELSFISWGNRRDSTPSNSSCIAVFIRCHRNVCFRTVA